MMRASAAVRKAYLWVGLALGVLLLVLAVRGVDPSGLQRSLLGTNLWLVALGLLAVAATIAAKALRWKLLFCPVHESLPLTTLASALLIGQTINFLLPARVGELARAYLVGDEEKHPALLALGTIVVEKTLDGLALIVLLGILFVVVPVPPWLRLSGAAAATVTAVLLAVVLLLTRGRERLVSASERWVQFHPGLERLGLNRRLGALADGLRSLRGSGMEVKIILWTVVIWLFAGLTNYLVLLAMDIEVPLLLASLLVLTVVHLGLAVPTSPARIGVFHYLCLLSLSVLGVEGSQALAYGFVLHSIVVLPIIGAGLVCLWKENLTLYRLVAELEGR